MELIIIDKNIFRVESLSDIIGCSLVLKDCDFVYYYDVYLKEGFVRIVYQASLTQNGVMTECEAIRSREHFIEKYLKEKSI